MKTKNKIYFGALLGVTILVAAARTFCLLTRYDPALGYLTDGFASRLPGLLLFMGTVAIAVSAFFWKNPAPHGESTSKAEPFFRTATAALCFFGGLLFLTNRSTNSTVLYILTGLLAIAFAIFCFATCTPDTSKSAGTLEALRPWFYLVGILAMLLLLISSYFDMTVTINGPFTTPTIFSVLISCVFFLMEARATMGRPLYRLHTIAATVACFFCLSVGASSLLFSLFGNGGSAVTIMEPARPMLFSAVGCSAAARLIALLKDAPADVENQEK